MKNALKNDFVLNFLTGLLIYKPLWVIGIASLIFCFLFLSVTLPITMGILFGFVKLLYAISGKNQQWLVIITILVLVLCLVNLFLFMAMIIPPTGINQDFIWANKLTRNGIFPIW